MLIAEFGSKHNGLHNVYSDKDLLIISDDWEQIKKAANHYTNCGFSISTFHLDRALYLTKKGSLFFKHIIDESVVLYDGNKHLNSISHHWNARSNYTDEIESNLELLEILNYAPKCKYSNNYIADILIISIRNILIRKIASHGIYVFDWMGISKNALSLRYISLCDITLILYSRNLKNRYRSGYYDDIPRCVIEQLVSLTSRISNNKISYRFVEDKQILSMPERLNNGSYKQLRALEALCCLYSFDPKMGKYLELIKKPNYFCNTNAIHKT
ncbi:hypothetical protein [Aeromonas salmonicida]|uniref:hypothetical protein n=1 Tax=Aeromonas salmonicida TaxID=645 RepID=UPI003CEDF13D